MTINNFIKAALILSGLVFLTTAQAASEPQSAPAQVAVCSACHGANGQSANSQWPHLAGQHEGYLVDQLKAFKQGTRTNSQMAGLLDKVSDEDIKVIAAYYASLPRASVKAADSADAELINTGQQRAGYCMGCHGVEGVPANTEWPVLAGQYSDYLFKQLKAFKSGERDNIMMQVVLRDFKEADLQAVAAYYSHLTAE